MTQRFLLTVLFLISIQFLKAQTVKWSSSLQENRKFPYLKILGEDFDENIYVLRSNMTIDNDQDKNAYKNRSFLLQYFSDGLNLIWETDLKTSFQDGHITDVKMINDKVIVTSYLYDKKGKKYYFYSQYFGKDNKWFDKPVLLDSLQADSMDENSKPELIYSHDQTKIAFAYRKLDRDEKSQVFRITMLDTNISVKYVREITIPVSTQLFIPLDKVISDQGSFILLGVHYVSEKKIKSPDQSYYELYGYNPILDRMIHTTIRSSTKFLIDAEMAFDNRNHNVVVAGFYSDKTTYSSAGVFYYNMTEDSLKELKAIQTPFNTQYLQKFLGDQKENRELVNYSIDRLIVRKDGGVALLAESMYQNSRSYFDYYMQTYISHIYYHYGNIMVLSVNPDGNILWNDVISKDQNSIDDGGLFSSYISAVSIGRLATVYNKFADDNSSVLITYIDADGKQKTDVLFNEIERISVAAQSAKQINDDTVLLPAYKQNKFYLVKINF